MPSGSSSTDDMASSCSASASITFPFGNLRPCAWKILESLEEKVDNMKKLMPLVGDLRNPAMRERHWTQLMEEVGKTFDPHSEDFTLETVIALGLEHYQETITTLSTAAGKELAIEEALVRIAGLGPRQCRAAARATGCVGFRRRAMCNGLGG